MTQYREWLQALLTKHGIPHPDGRPLYAYRLSDADFSNLHELLRVKGRVHIENMGGHDHFLTCWFLYASEWWKRSYPGGAWSWTPMFASLGYGELVQQKRREWVEAASDFWRLKDENIGGKKFLGKVVVNGGLPLQLIKEADGKLYGLLNAALGEALRSSVPLSHAQLLNQIELQSSYLPKSYRQQTVYLLLAQVINTILTLKNLLADKLDQDPVAYLDRTHPDWLNDFPLQIDSDSARRLFVKLIRQATSSTRQVKQSFAVVRQLRFNEDCSEWRYECAIQASSRYATSTVAEMLHMTEDILPSPLDLVIVSEDKAVTIGQMFRRDSEYLVKINHPSLPKDFFHQSLRLDISRFGQKLGHLELEACEAPDPEAPWIFDDRNPVCHLLWAGSHRVSASSCLVLIPEIATVSSEMDKSTRLSIFKQKQLFRLSHGSADIVVNQEQYEVSCGAANGQLQESVLWGSNRVYIDSFPTYVFYGRPRLERVDSEGARQTVPSNELVWRCDNVNMTVDSIRRYGIGTLYWKKQGKILLRQRAVCLPDLSKFNDESGTATTKHFEMKFIQAEKPTGIIKLNGWPISSVTCNTPQVQIHSTNTKSNWELTVVSEMSPPPLSVEMTFLWPDGQVQRVSAPFPIQGAFVVDDLNNPVNTTDILSLEQIHYLQVHLRGKANRPWQIRIELMSRQDLPRIPDQVVKFRPVESDNAQVIRLYDLREQIRRLLSLSDNLDARVRIHFEYAGVAKKTITVARYSHALDCDQSKGWVTLENASGEVALTELLEKSELRTVPLLDAEQASRKLTPVASSGTLVGSWDFEPEIKQPGLWLIYPSEHSLFKVRPILWFVPERYAKPAPEYQGLKAAMTLQNRAERLAALSLVFSELADNPQHKDWKYVQIFIDKFGHLPLASLDIWVAMIKVPKAIVCSFLCLENFTDKIAHRLCEELPFEWILTSPHDWLSVIETLSAHTREQNNEREERFLKNELEYRLEWIYERQPALHLSVKLALVKGLGIEKVDNDTRLLLRFPQIIADAFLNGLLIDDNSDAASFLRRATQSEISDIPTQLNFSSQQFANTACGEKIFKKYHKLHASDRTYSLVVAPMMIAYEVAQGGATSWLNEAEQLYALRQYREFDRVWFDESYKVAMACAFNEGLITV